MRASILKEMSLKCQRDSYLRRCVSRVVSCSPARGGGEGKFEVVLEDTVLFPEGGGQPCDKGTVNGVVEVLRLERRGPTAVHFTDEPIEAGAEVEIEVDWERRFDHMQQHSAQHLITALADRDFGHKTTSWNLAVGLNNRCYVELDAHSLSPDELRTLEETCNEAIRSQIPMTPRWYQSGTPELEKVRSRGLPDDFVGSEVRVVEIEGIDTNMCCGTHVSNLSHLQCLKLLHAESKRGSTIIYYIAGGRVQHYLDRAYANERTLNKLLSVSMDEHRDAVEKLVKTNKSAVKLARGQLREIAHLLAQLHISTPSPSSLFSLHREDGDTEFMNVLANELVPQGVFVFVTVGGEKGAGHFLLAGKDDDVAKLGPKVAEVLGGKGGGRKGRYQGKASQLGSRAQAEDIIRTLLAQK